MSLRLLSLVRQLLLKLLKVELVIFILNPIGSLQEFVIELMVYFKNKLNSQDFFMIIMVQLLPDLKLWEN